MVPRAFLKRVTKLRSSQQIRLSPVHPLPNGDVDRPLLTVFAGEMARHGVLTTMDFTRKPWEDQIFHVDTEIELRFCVCIRVPNERSRNEPFTAVKLVMSELTTICQPRSHDCRKRREVNAYPLRSWAMPAWEVHLHLLS
jgi:hypothetical protein